MHNDISPLIEFRYLGTAQVQGEPNKRQVEFLAIWSEDSDPMATELKMRGLATEASFLGR